MRSEELAPSRGLKQCFESFSFILLIYPIVYVQISLRVSYKIDAFFNIFALVIRSPLIANLQREDVR